MSVPVEMLEDILRAVMSLTGMIDELKKMFAALQDSVSANINELKSSITNIQSQLAELRQSTQRASLSDREQRLIMELVNAGRIVSSHVYRLETMLTAHREFILKISDSLSSIVNQLASSLNEFKDVKSLLLLTSKDITDKIGLILSEISKCREDVTVLLEELKLDIRSLRESIESLKEILTTTLSKS